MSELSFYMYTLYNHPRDFPDHWVIRAWRVERGDPEPKPDPDVLLFETASLAIEWADSRGLTMLDRQPDDDPCIACTFL